MRENKPKRSFQDLSEQAHGPALTALWSEDDQQSQFQLGTREYDWHSHLRGQIFCVESGLVHVRTRHGSWLLPPHRAGWIPPGDTHKVSITGAMSGWSILLTPAVSVDLPDRPCVIGVSEVMRALVRRAASWAGQKSLKMEQQRLIAVLLDEVKHAPHEPLHLPMPTDRRLLRVTAAILKHPDDNRSLHDWASWCGMSARTLSRVIRTETDLSFAQWRQQARLLLALERLARGEPVAAVADALGYATPSNFIVMFRRSLGESPGRYFGALTRGANEKKPF